MSRLAWQASSLRPEERTLVEYESSLLELMEELSFVRRRFSQAGSSSYAMSCPPLARELTLPLARSESLYCEIPPRFSSSGNSKTLDVDLMSETSLPTTFFSEWLPRPKKKISSVTRDEIGENWRSPPRNHSQSKKTSAQNPILRKGTLKRAGSGKRYFLYVEWFPSSPGKRVQLIMEMSLTPLMKLQPCI